MRYRLLGRTGVRVSEYMLGTMSYGSDGNTDEGECIRIVHSALDRLISSIQPILIRTAKPNKLLVRQSLAGAIRWFWRPNSGYQPVTGEQPTRDTRDVAVG